MFQMQELYQSEKVNFKINKHLNFFFKCFFYFFQKRYIIEYTVVITYRKDDLNEEYF
jgi:hypothetical protein